MERCEDEPLEILPLTRLRADSRREALSWRHGVLLATAGLLVARIPVILHRSFDPDELEHSHAAWCVFKGMLPYKDFFEHHTPWYYYALRPLFQWFDVENSVESARRFLLAGRGLSLLLTVVSLLLVWRIGRLWEDRRVGVVTGLLLLSQTVFFQKTVEMRPDVLALPFFLGCLWSLLRGLARSAESPAKGIWHLVGGGLALGAAIMCTQKMLFVLPGILAGLAIWSLSAETRTTARARVFSLLVFVASVCIPAAATWAAFARVHAGDAFIANNFLLNARWKHIATHQFGMLLLTSGPVLAACLVGLSTSVSSSLRSRQRHHGKSLLACTLAGLFAGVLVMPSAHRQYYLMPLPIVCLFAAEGLLFLWDRAQKWARVPVLVVALGPVAVVPAVALHESLQSRNDVQLARLRHVLETTKPTETVMDGWQGTGVFRPHAFHYFFLHEETVAMLPDPPLDAYLDALESGRIRPRLIAMDENLAALGPRFLRFVQTNYVSSDGFFYSPKDRID